MLTNMDPPPAEGNFCDNSNRPVKPHIMERYNRHMGFFDISDCMSNSYSMDQCNLKWTTKLFFRLLDLTVLNSWILLFLCGAKYTHRDFRLLLVRNLTEEAGKSQDCPTPRLVGRASWRQQILCGSRAVITNTGQRNQRKSTVVFVHLTARERPRSTNAQSVTQACTWCLVSWIITQK